MQWAGTLRYVAPPRPGQLHHRPARGNSKKEPGSQVNRGPKKQGRSADRAVPGHWEGDLILGLDSSAIGTLVERTTRFTMLLHLPRMAERGVGARVKNGPALAGHGAEAIRDSISSTITDLPEQLRRSLTWDQGTEMAQHAQLKIDTGLNVYFCDPIAHGSVGQTRTQTGCCASIFQKAPT